jgi:DNA-damage-inducible protein D
MNSKPKPSSELSLLGDASFEKLKQTNEHGAEYWSARDLQTLLGYSQWRRFEQAIERAQESCSQSGNEPENHFAGAGKMVGLGSGSQRKVPDFHLSRFACYLIAQNGDPRKPEIAQAQKYFAIQTRRQELGDQLASDLERIELRKNAGEEFKMLSGAAHQAGVQSRMFGIFHDAGYKGLYGGLGRDEIKRKKRIPEKDNLMDRMNATELAANQFRMTQTRDKLAREGVRSETAAIRAHQEVGKEVREAIRRIGGTLPEQIPPAEHIKEVERRVKSAVPKLELDEKDAGGLLGKAGKE